MKYTSAQAILISQWMLFNALLGACGTETSAPAKAVETPAPRSSANTDYSKDDSNDFSLRVLDPRPKVSAFRIDDATFRLNGFRVGLQDYMSYSTPVLTWSIPEEADYLEILRCTSDTIIKGTFDNLKDVELGSTSLGNEVKIFQQNNFWEAAKNARGCTVLTESVSDKIYLDSAIPLGPSTYRYLAHACVNPERLIDTTMLGNRNCSRMVVVSNQLPDFKNLRVENERLALERAQRLRAKADGLGRLLYYKAIELNNALVSCEQTEVDRLIRIKRKQSITKIIGFGVSLAANLLLPESGVAAVKAGTKSWSALSKEMWADRNTIMGEGMQAGTAINWLFSSPSDYPKSCITAQRVTAETTTAAAEMKSTAQLFAQAMDEADAMRTSK